MSRPRVSCLIVVAVALAALTSCSSGESVDDYCESVRSFAEEFDPEREPDASYADEYLSGIIKLADTAPADLQEDAATVAAPLRETRSDLESRGAEDLSWDEIGSEYLSPLLDDEEWLAANERMTEFNREECGLEAPSPFATAG